MYVISSDKGIGPNLGIELMRHYLDYNATAPMLSQAKEAVVNGIDEFWANSFSQHQLGQKVSAVQDKARRRIADALSVGVKQLRFTSGASESNTWILSHFKRKGKLLCSAIEHPSVLEHSDLLIPVLPSGIIDCKALTDLLKSRGQEISLVSIMAANNETGVIQPTDEIGDICKQFHMPFHCDATQALGKLTSLPKADFLSYSAHKLGGPKGIGCVVLSSEIDSLILGGPQERGSRAGTQNVPALLGFAAAVEHFTQPDVGLRMTLEKGLLKLGATIIGGEADRLPNTVCALFDAPGELLTMALDMRGIAVSTGAACSSGASKESHVLEAMGYSGRPVRFSFGPNFDSQGCQDVLKAVSESLEAICEW